MGAAATITTDPLMRDAKALDFRELKRGGHELLYRIVGTKGAVDADAFGRTLKRWEFGMTPAGFTSTLVETLTWDDHENYSYTHNTFDQARDIVDRVRRAQSPLTSARDSYETTKLCFAAEESADCGQLVSLNSLD
jgi:hypothetical protein